MAQICNEDHGSLRASSGQHLPDGFRLVDCRRHIVVDVDTTSTTPEYLALSYVWGRASWRTLRQIDNSLDLSNAPQVIEDAITVTLNLGFRYLWVDRYCIHQNSQDAKMTQINSMDTIYSSAQATIVAAAGSGPHVGLPGVRVRRLTQPTAHNQDRTFIWSMTRCSELIRVSLWNARDWTLQETLLSHRRILFTNEQVYFQCRNKYSCESYPVMMDLEVPISPLKEFYESAFQIESFGEPEGLETALRDFARRQLSYNADTLNAFRGIMKQYERESGVHFFYGLPLLAQPMYDNHDEYDIRPGDPANWTLEKRLATALTWNSHVRESYKWLGGTGLDRYGNHIQRIEEFPSWSWAGWRWPKDELKDSSFLGCYYCSSVKTTIYTADDNAIAWDALRDEPQHDFPDERKLSLMITIQAWAFPVKLLRFGSWYSPKGKEYASEVVSRPFPYLCQFFLYEGKWSWKPVECTVVYFGPSPHEIKRPMKTARGPAVFFMLIKEKAEGKWERAGEGQGDWCDIQEFLAWNDDLVPNPGVFERRKFDLV